MLRAIAIGDAGCFEFGFIKLRVVAFGSVMEPQPLAHVAQPLLRGVVSLKKAAIQLAATFQCAPDFNPERSGKQGAIARNVF
ncbi:hypothetical protein GPU89_19810 [Burkholderia cepacia]|nr:hypothetical protein [Burkholderia cepacia]